jgi:hypothetical protein
MVLSCLREEWDMEVGESGGSGCAWVLLVGVSGVGGVRSVEDKAGVEGDVNGIGLDLGTSELTRELRLGASGVGEPISRLAG